MVVVFVPQLFILTMIFEGAWEFTQPHVVVFEESIQLRSSDYPVGNCFGSIGCLTHSYQPFNPCITVTGA